MANEALSGASPALLVSVPGARAPGGARLPELSAAAAETADVQAALPHAVMLAGDFATTQALQKVVRGAEIFHFAGHGWSEGGNGALLLAPDSNGEAQYLTAREIAGEDWSHCRIAVLSACLTAAGELKGPINNQSLVRALLAAGAHQVVAAKWSISSEATRALMKEFYSQLLQGRGAPEALNRAEMTLAGSPQWSHPYYWAAFEVFHR
jgi:CHAT domain-containing protein